MIHDDHELLIHISIPFQMVENLEIIVFLLYTFVFPVDLTDQGKEILLFSILRITMNFKTFVMLSFLSLFDNFKAFKHFKVQNTTLDFEKILFSILK